ncbi:IS1595 family transposase [Ruegeria sp.]|uniref:IS1595 family transposase n=1 Tax=Ruegeria sp. TaxID=1879320 RepID=UPI003AFF7113
MVESTDKETLQGFVNEHAVEGATLYTDEASAYKGIDRPHEVVKHSVGEYVRDQAHTNGLESFWAPMKRGYNGVYHKMSPKHLQRYVDEFQHRHNNRPKDTIDQMGGVVHGMAGKNLPYKKLIEDNGLNSGARS